MRLRSPRARSYVRDTLIPPQPAPVHVGPIGWLWRNLFASMADFSSRRATAWSVLIGVATLLALWFCVAQIANFLGFALIDAVWHGPKDGQVKACRPTTQGGIQEAGWFGACYPFLAEKWRQLIYGFYPENELWRVNQVFLIGGLGSGWLVAHAVPVRRLWGIGVIFVAAGLGLSISTIFGEGLLDRVGVQILLLIGFVWLILPENAPRRGVGLFMLTAYPLISFILLTGGDIEVAPKLLLAGAMAAGVLLSASLAAERGLLGEVGDLLGEAARTLGWVSIAATALLFFASDIFVDLIEAAGGVALTDKQIAALKWWSEIRSDTDAAPTIADLDGFQRAFGAALSTQELAQLRALQWERPFIDATTAPGTRELWPLPPVETSAWGGLMLTLILAVAGALLSLPLGVLLALGGRSRLPAVRSVSRAYISLWRGAPMISAILAALIMAPLFFGAGAELDRLALVLLGLVLFNAAHQAQIIRGGLDAAPKGQAEAAAALRMPYGRTLRLIVLPQALATVIPGLINNFVGLFKDATIVLLLGMSGLLGAAKHAATDLDWGSQVQAASAYMAASAIFFLFCFGLTRYASAVDREIRRGRNR
ncbi:MAG: ABC transporter permease subunit [Neomegalonema sp.]|nr:ABC transporter permease subunit [Neomegalonema sp.]